jgi:hypothetical protein
MERKTGDYMPKGSSEKPRITKTIIKRASDTVSVKKSINDDKWADTFFNTVKKLREQGLTYGDITNKLSKEGWTTPQGGQLNEPVVSRFMTSRGFRLNKKHSRGGATLENVITAQTARTEFDKEMITLIQSEFPEETKLNFASMLIDKYKKKK